MPKLYTVTYTTPALVAAHLESNNIVVEAESVASAKLVFANILSKCVWFKVPFGDTEMIATPDTMSVVKITLYKGITKSCKK